MISAGKLDRIVTLQRAHTVKNEFGTPTQVWTAMTTCRAERVEAEAAEIADKAGVLASEKVVLRLRWHPVTTADRVLFEGRTYDISHVRQIGRRVGVELTCEA